MYEVHQTSGDSNRRILKTVRPVVWEGEGAQSPAPSPITLSILQVKQSVGDYKAVARSN